MSYATPEVLHLHGVPVFLRGIMLGTKRTASGEFTAGPPTLVSLGFEWRITGDDNRHAYVDVTFRKRGDRERRKALPLLREQRELIGDPPPAGAAGPGRGAAAANAAQPARYPLFKYTAPNMFAGSVLNLEPDTQYECHFVLGDPDGVKAPSGMRLVVRAANPRWNYARSGRFARPGCRSPRSSTRSMIRGADCLRGRTSHTSLHGAF